MEQVQAEVFAGITVGAVLRNRFSLKEELAADATGGLFKAIDLLRQEAGDADPYVTIRVLSQNASPAAIIACQRETKKAQKLVHPNIVDVHDFDRDANISFIITEHFKGRTLDQVLQGRPAIALSSKDKLRIISTIASALAFAHRQSVVHADVSPRNILLGEDNQIKLSEFGIAAAISRSAEPDSRQGTVDSRPRPAVDAAYASPQVLEGLVPDPRDDVYSLACVAYELLTGRHPFTRVPASRARLEGRRVGKSEALTDRQWEALQHGLAFDREQRSPSVDGFIGALTGEEKTPSWLLLALGAGLVVASAIGGSILFMYRADVAREDAALAAFEKRSTGSSSPAADAERPIASPLPTSSTMPEPAAAPPKPGALARQDPPPPAAAIPSSEDDESLAPAIAPLPVGPRPTIDELLASTRCSLLQASTRASDVQLFGFTGETRAVESLRDALITSGSHLVSIDSVQPLKPTYCQTIDTLRPYVQANRGGSYGLFISAKNVTANFTEGDELILNVQGPATDTYLYVDYYSLDGNVVHMHPSLRARDHRFAAFGQLTLGGGATGGNWVVAKPFGTEVIAAIASPVSLFGAIRPEVEPASRYLADLSPALQRAAASSRQPVVADVLMITTNAKR